MARPESIAFDSEGDMLITAQFGNRIYRIDSSSQVITTIAGSGRSGSGSFEGEGGPAQEADFHLPVGLALDAASNIFFLDDDRFLRRVDGASGVISTIAGIPRTVTLGDGEPAFAADLFQPFGIALDQQENLFSADLSNDRIRRVDAATGIISTVAGRDENGDTSLGDGGPASDALLSGPIALTFDNQGNLFIVDNVHGRIRRIDATSGIISTVAGSRPGSSEENIPALEAALFDVYDIDVDSEGNIFLAVLSENRIRRIDGVSGLIDSVAGNGSAELDPRDGILATETSLNKPRGVMVAQNGDLLIADTRNNRVRRVDTVSRIIRTVAGNGQDSNSGDGGPATEASIFFPYRLAFDQDGALLIASFSQVRRVDPGTGIISTVAGTPSSSSLNIIGDGGPAIEAPMIAVDVATDNQGNILIADARRNRIRIVRRSSP